MSAAPPEVSVVTTVWNERPSLRPFATELVGVLRELGRPFEVLAVDDGSTDGSLAELRSLAAELPELRPLPRPHAGKAEALLHGFAEARAPWVVTLDADLQDEPQEIPRMLAQAKEGTFVIGIRHRADSGWRRASSAIARVVRHAVIGDGIADIGCPLRVLPRSALTELPRFEGLHRFLPAILEARGLRVVQLPVAHRPRRYGRSKYGTWDRALRGAAHLVRMRSWLARQRRA